MTFIIDYYKIYGTAKYDVDVYKEEGVWPKCPVDIKQDTGAYVDSP